ncbi:MAG: transporter substrate-binding domain-containing protein [Desulfovibrionaceae bacterium]
MQKRSSFMLLKISLCTLLFMLPALHLSGAGPLRVYTEFTRPLQYVDEAGNLTGFNVEVVREIMRRAGCEGSIEIVPWKRGYLEAQEDPEVVLFPTYRTPEREALFQWAEPIFKTGWVFYKKKGSPLVLSCLDDARGVKAISVYGEDARHQFLMSRGFSNLEVVTDNRAGWQMLLSDRVDLVASSNMVLILPEGQYDAPLDQIEPALIMAEFPLYPVFSPKADPALVQSWRDATRSMVEDGTYAALYEQWFSVPDFSPYSFD